MANGFEQLALLLTVFWGGGIILAFILPVNWEKVRRRLHKLIRPYKIKLS